MLTHETWICFGAETVSFGFDFKHKHEHESEKDPYFCIQIGESKTETDCEQAWRDHGWIADLFVEALTREGTVIGFQITDANGECANYSPSFEVLSADRAFLEIKELGKIGMERYTLEAVYEGEIEDPSMEEPIMRPFVLAA